MTSHLPTVGLDAFDAWLFDLDGVLTDTAEVHAAAWKLAFDPVLAEESERRTSPVAAFDPVDDYLRYVDGRPRADGVRTFLDARGIRLGEGHPGDGPSARTVCGIANGKNDLVRHILDTRGVRVFPGAVTLLHALRARRVRTAVVSASENTGAVLRSGGISDLIDVCVDGIVVRERCLAGKPAPDSYLEAARMLEVPPARAVVVEDALVGVEAGRSGRFGLVVGVDHGGQAAELIEHGADVVVSDLADLVP
ncbi:MAG TPA: beta-phosphoglucomutase family hydrolase [Acidimicrobiales bacterium]